jgi:hypothetical protein
MAKRRRGKPLAPDDPRRKGIANLKPIKPGEVRNPKGKNGSERIREFHAFADELVSVPQGRGKAPLIVTRAQAARLALFDNVLRGDTPAQKVFIEQLQGRARQSVEVTGEGGGPVRTGGEAAVIEMLQKLAGEKKD